MAEVCGTGGWTGPQPGDPDNSSVLSAVGTYGGIDVFWSYPNINPHAVAHALLYRSTSWNDDSPARIAVVNSDRYFDKVAEGDTTRYYYWLEIVSIHGTVGTRIGPADAVAHSSIEQTIRELTGKIDAGVLAQSLKGRIDVIELNRLGITQETINRAENDDALGVYLNEIRGEVDNSLAVIQDERIARATADSAFTAAVNTLYASVGDNLAAIQEEKRARVTADSAIASSVETVQSKLDNDVASVQSRMETNVNRIDGEIQSIGALYHVKVDVNGMVGGFGVYNDGRSVEAGFDVDRFWVGRTNYDKKKPFIIENGQVYISEALIENGTITNAKIGEVIQSRDFKEGNRGWRIQKNGDAEFNDATFRGTITASDIQGAVNVTQSARWSGSVSLPRRSSRSQVVTKHEVRMPWGNSQYRPFFCITAMGSSSGETGVDISVQVWVDHVMIEDFFSFAMAYDSMGITVAGSTDHMYPAGSFFEFVVLMGSYEGGTVVNRTSGYFGGMA